ncbi:MAG: TRAP transporter substrate-binding protein DctP [Alphaproteobacteria bacterium]|nr:TRAP transporter substrate-binding protein DctP [Alphaproteobacteria bacterium]MBV9861455.1 TRAP transporter substrate-binding protein DctP [Alphaproteobacteria bacterium]
MTIFFRIVCAAAGLALAAPFAAAADAQFTLRASLDTSATHIRTISVGDYLKQLQEASGGRIQTQLFHSAQLFRDRDVAKALRQGNIEMAVPGSWVLSGFVPDTDFFLLPIMAGQPSEVVFKVVDGKVGQMVDDELDKKLETKVLGPWFALGFNNEYSTKKPINEFSDLAGLKLRNSGGAGQALRAKFFDAIPNTTAWPDVPLALSQGTFDALSSTNESVASAKLWDSGVKYAFEDHAYFAMYVPLISQDFYNKLPPDLQKLVVDLWAKNIGKWRQDAAAAQAKARQEDEEHGIKFVDPSPQRLTEIRQKLMTTEDQVAKELKIGPELVKTLAAEIQGGS